MKKNLQEILFQKYQDKNLASLYILNYDSKSVDPSIWVNDFLTQFTKLSDHPDVLKIFKTEKENEYKVDSASIALFLKFLNYKPLQLEKKFVFIFDAQDISTILSNKLLKVFEELDSNICLFLIVPDNAQILATVASRSIKLQIPPMENANYQKTDFSGIKTPQDLLALLKTGGLEDEKAFIEQAIEHFLTLSKSSAQSFQEAHELLAVLSEYETYSNFNNSKLSRMTRFFS
ncbi:MAG: hypothetical protein Q7U04_00795 [Bacteriovorax sp.]|nr:hypothetical protein [Bacteriovorax sp.]